jgi:hypothetical protein
LNTLRRENICFKVLFALSKFEEEYKNIDKLKEIFEDDFNVYTTFYQYDDCVGFKIEIEPGTLFNFKREHTATPTIQTDVLYVILQHKCMSVMDMIDRCDIGEINVDITPVLELLHEAGYVHNDITLTNLVYCESDQRYKLIDYGEMTAVSSFQYSDPDTVVFRQNAEFEKTLKRIENIKAKKKLEQKITSTSSGETPHSHGGSSTKKTNRTIRKRHYNKKNRRDKNRKDKSKLKYTTRKPKYYKK